MISVAWIPPGFKSTSGFCRLCAERLGFFPIVDRKTVSRSNRKVFSELKLVTQVCAKDRTNMCGFSGEHDVKMIQMWRAGSESEAVECETIFFWGKHHLLRQGIAMQGCELLFTKSVSMKCVVCREDVTSSIEAFPCEECHVISCVSCDWKGDKPKCPVCRAFFATDARASPRRVHGTDCDSAGSVPRTNPDKALRNIKDTAGRDFEALIDEAKVVSGEEVVDLIDIE